VYALFVEPGHEGRGVGRRLHDTMMEWFFAAGVDDVWLSTDPNTRAERFYRKAGWMPTGSRPNGEIRFEMSRGRWLTRHR
jgi:GNAT superfamily N-acetyltransferase